MESLFNHRYQPKILGFSLQGLSSCLPSSAILNHGMAQHPPQFRYKGLRPQIHQTYLLIPEQEKEQ